MPIYLAPLSDEDKAYIEKYLAYDPLTGAFTWKITRRQMAAGSIAGTVNPRGYRCISIRGKIRRAGRLAWFISYGVWPEHEIDHENRNRDDNRLTNLRAANRPQNAQNRLDKNKANQTGFRGVVMRNEGYSRPFEASIGVNRKRLYLGSFSTPEAAHEAYKMAAKKMHKEFCLPELANE